MKRVMVEVTAADIRRGKRQDAWSCPIARALLRTLHGTTVAVTTATWECGRLFGKLSEPAQRFVARFDKKRGSVKPAVFLLPVGGGVQGRGKP